jgi:hypothetical protein
MSTYFLLVTQKENKQNDQDSHLQRGKLSDLPPGLGVLIPKGEVISPKHPQNQGAAVLYQWG